MGIHAQVRQCFHFYNNNSFCHVCILVHSAYASYILVVVKIELHEPLLFNAFISSSFSLKKLMKTLMNARGTC